MKTPIFILVCLLLAIPCRVEATCEPNIPGDITGDCKVDFNDFAMIASYWLKAGESHEWVAINRLGVAQAIAVDSNNNIYVTGGSQGYTTIKYSPDSNQPLWVARYSPGRAYAITVDSNDNIYVTGESDQNYVTVKYSPDSNQPVWVARYNGPDNDSDGAYAIAVDSNNNIYVTGRSYGTYWDYATIKYSPDSNEAVWVARYNGPANNEDWAYAIAVDSNDNIYVTGWSKGSGTRDDYATIKYSPDSNQPVWVARYNGPDNLEDRPQAIAIDSNDNIYVTGDIYSHVTSGDYATIKYSPDSNQPVWVARYNSPANHYDVARAITVDSNDNIYVTGSDYTTIKYSSDSNQPVWVARYDDPANCCDDAYAIAVDSNNNIYVTGDSVGSGTYTDYVTVKYSPDSNEAVWVARYNSPNNSYDHAEAITVDSNDNIYVTGWSEGWTDPYATIKYSPDYTCTPEVTGDLNYDCKVDLYDLQIFCRHWLESNL